PPSGSIRARFVLPLQPSQQLLRRLRVGGRLELPVQPLSDRSLAPHLEIDEQVGTHFLVPPLFLPILLQLESLVQQRRVSQPLTQSIERGGPAGLVQRVQTGQKPAQPRMADLLERQRRPRLADQRRLGQEHLEELPLLQRRRGGAAGGRLVAARAVLPARAAE